MTFSDLWLNTIRRQPTLANEKTRIEMTVGQYRKAMEQSYHHGFAAGEEEASKNSSLFGRIFGK